MVHKIWDKDNDEEGISIRDSLIKSYFEIYFEPHPDSLKDPNELIANNLIRYNIIYWLSIFLRFSFFLTISSVIQEMSLAELISFEQLLGVMMSQQKVPTEVIELLWAVFSKSEVLILLYVDYFKVGRGDDRIGGYPSS